MKTKLTITQSELKQLYSAKKNRELCQILKITMPTLMSYLKKYKIQLKGSGNRQTKAKVNIIE